MWMPLALRQRQTEFCALVTDLQALLAIAKPPAQVPKNPLTSPASPPRRPWLAKPCAADGGWTVKHIHNQPHLKYKTNNKRH
jgi:hypothetical protein